jgi:NAD+ synthase (glutamine-hydrolysing)
LIKVALGQFEVQPGRPDLNTEKMLSMIAEAKEKLADIVVFPEMAIPGYLLGDMWEQRAFLEDCEYHGKLIIEASINICVIFGNVAMDWNKRNNDGRVRKYNSFFTAHNGKLLCNPNSPYPFVIKTLQPNYREFDDTRHFYSLQKLSRETGIAIESLLQPIQLNLSTQALNIGCLLCEDGWSDDYSIAPIEVLHHSHPIDLFINISSSPYTLGKNNKRNRVFSKQAQSTSTPLIYLNTTGIQNNGKTLYTFDGSSTVYNATGDIIAYCEPYKEKLAIVDIDLEKNSTPPIKVPKENEIASIYHALHYGIKKFLRNIHMKKVVIGVSGGIDSAVAAALYTKILGPQNILLVNMPSIYNSKTTKDLSYQLAKNLKCNYIIAPIQEVVDYTIKQIQETPITSFLTDEQNNLTVSSFVAENIQARDRSARILAGIAASFGGGFTCNANKSETTVGYSTLYGDQSGFLAALADLWKYQVYDLADYLNKEIYKQEIIPQATIDIVPSAELSHNQAVDEGKGDPIKYPYHDYLFRSFMEHWNRSTPQDILEWYQAGTLEDKLGCAPGLVTKYFPTTQEFIADLERWWNLYSGMAIAKRIQAPPILAISRRAYGFDHRESQNGPYYTAKYKKLKSELLAKPLI